MSNRQAKADRRLDELRVRRELPGMFDDAVQALEVLLNEQRFAPGDLGHEIGARGILERCKALQQRVGFGIVRSKTRKALRASEKRRERRG